MAREPVGLKLVVVAPSSHHGGAELVLNRAVRAAVARGWEVCCLCPAGPLAHELETSGVTTVTIPELGLPSGRRSLAAVRLAARSVSAALALRRAARGADRVLVNGLLGLPAVTLVRPRPPVVLLVHDVIRRPDRAHLLRRLRSTVDAAIAVSPAAAAPLADIGLHARVVPNGTPWPVRPAPSPPPSPPVVGCVAALTSWKGQHVLIEALARLESHDVVLELVGEALPKDAAYAAALRSQVEAAGLVDRVVFCGYLADPLSRVRGWTVAVTASQDPEPFGLATLEAMSVGVPVVGTNHGATRELLGEAGLLVAPGSARELADALSLLIGDGDLRRRCAAAGRARVAEHYGLHDRTEELLDAIAEPLP